MSIDNLTLEIISKAITAGTAAVLDDGGRLYLNVKPTGAASWIFRYQWEGKDKKLGFGAYVERTLEEARELAFKARRLVRDGRDPRCLLDGNGGVVSDVPTSALFKDFAPGVLESACEDAPGAKPRHRKYRESWVRTLAYLAPLNNKQLHEITTADVAKVLKPIWLAKPTTARAVRQRLHQILNSAASDYPFMANLRNPAQVDLVKAHKDLGRQPAKGSVRGKHTPLNYRLAPKFWLELLALDCPSARALQFLVLTGVRTNELLQMRFDQVQPAEYEDGAVRWVIPGSVMKNGLQADIPLCPRALAIVEQQRHEKSDRQELVFVSPFAKQDLGSLGERTLLKLVQQTLGYNGKSGKPKATTHGFRGTLRGWGADETMHQREVLELVLHHIEGGEAEIAYLSGDGWKKRKAVLLDWERYVTSAEAQPALPSNVVPFAA